MLIENLLFTHSHHSGFFGVLTMCQALRMHMCTRFHPGFLRGLSKSRQFLPLPGQALQEWAWVLDGLGPCLVSRWWWWRLVGGVVCHE